MRTMQVLVLGLGLALTPLAASAQTASAPEAPAAATDGWDTTTLLAAGTGAAVGVVAVNMVTGGAMLAPMVGAAASNMVGGSLLGASALAAPARQALVQTMAVLGTAAAGAGLGYWLVSE